LLIDSVATRLYGKADSKPIHAVAAPTISQDDVRNDVLERLSNGERVLAYFDSKLGGEVSLSATSRSPEMAFDVTLVELLVHDRDIRLGLFGILEIQTMDFHGSYRGAVSKLRNALELHPTDFGSVLQANQWWAGDGIEGPNIANVFKRTFYQMVFKFNFGSNTACAGTVLTIPASVWDSWQPFLAAPTLRSQEDGTFRLTAPGEDESDEKVPGWILVFDFDQASPVTPNPLRFTRSIGVTANALAHFALSEAPRAATLQLLSETGIYATLQRRLRKYWPDHSMGVAAP
jgi:hypothetical protein